MDTIRERLKKILVDYPKDTYKYSNLIGISKQTLDRFMWGNSKTFSRVSQKIEGFVLQEELRELIERYEDRGENIRLQMNKDLNPLTTKKILSDHKKEFTHKYRSEIEAVITKYENSLSEYPLIQPTKTHDDDCDICERYSFWKTEKNHCEKRMALLAKGHEQYIYSEEDTNE